MPTNWRQRVAGYIADVHEITRGASGPRKGFRILMYHSIGSVVADDPTGLFSISPEEFAIHVTELAQFRGGKIVGLLEGKASDQDLEIAVTFDDGYQDNLRVAAPVLQKHGIPFTVFVVPSFIDSGNPLYLSRSQLRELAAMPGVTIGAHGATHVPLTKCDEKKLADELVSSKDCLEDLLGEGIKTVAYPFGAVNSRVRDATEKAGYTMGVSTHFDINHAGRDPLLLCRTPVLSTDSLQAFGQKLCGDWDWYRWRYRDPASA